MYTHQCTRTRTHTHTHIHLSIGHFKHSDEDYLPPAKRQKTSSMGKGHGSTKRIGAILADILTDVPEVDIKTMPGTVALKTDTSERYVRVGE